MFDGKGSNLQSLHEYLDRDTEERIWDWLRKSIPPQSDSCRYYQYSDTAADYKDELVSQKSSKAEKYFCLIFHPDFQDWRNINCQGLEFDKLADVLSASDSRPTSGTSIVL